SSEPAWRSVARTRRVAMATDPLDVLRQTDAPLAPDPAFAARLRSRLEAALGRTPPGGGAMSSQSTTYVSSATRSVTPYLCVDDTRRAIAWYGDIFGARQSADLILMDDGRVGHAEIRIGDSVIMLADEFPEIGVVSPKSQEGSSA